VTENIYLFQLDVGFRIGDRVCLENQFWSSLLRSESFGWLDLVGWGGTEVPAALCGCVQYRGHLREGMINHVVLHTVQRLG